MAYMSRERKAEIVALAKPILRKYGVKATFAVRNHSTIVCNIKSSPLDFFADFNAGHELRPETARFDLKPAKDCIDVNVYHFRSHFSGKCLKFLEELIGVMNLGNWDKSDVQTDYFNVGWYVDVNIGQWNKPYVLDWKGK